jgi:glycosyltransferase involved in cell wall biosynthesis
MTVLVSMPYYGCPEQLPRAVASVLDQTHDDLVLCIIADGDEPPPLHRRDQRIVTYRLPHNHGAYFAQAVALEANPHQWYAPHGADDWTQPDHLERLLAVGEDVVVTGCYWRHENGRTKIVQRNLETGLFATRVLREIGGYNPAERVGQDSMLLNVLRHAGHTLHRTDVPTYHYVKRAGSLTKNADTGHGSAMRQATVARNRAIIRQVRNAGTPAAIRRIRAAHVPPAVAEQVHRHAEKLRGLL